MVLVLDALFPKNGCKGKQCKSIFPNFKNQLAYIYIYNIYIFLEKKISSSFLKCAKMTPIHFFIIFVTLYKNK